MSFTQELASWSPFNNPSNVQKMPATGSQAPSEKQLQFPRSDQKPVIITFLRHCGCPFAEKTFKQVRSAAERNTQIHFVAVSHSNESHTQKWLRDVGGAGKIEVIIDHEREIFAKYGLGASSFWAVLNPWSMRNVLTLGRQENVWNRPTESGSRWQTAGMFAVDGSGVLTYSHRAETADDLGDLEAALSSIKRRSAKL